MADTAQNSNIFLFNKYLALFMAFYVFILNRILVRPLLASTLHSSSVSRQPTEKKHIHFEINVSLFWLFRMLHFFLFIRFSFACVAAIISIVHKQLT